ncbi:MAG: galactokinase [Treponema sp.]|jgi:galactokinase|nr:galactokinase [Treponema sp.]
MIDNALLKKINSTATDEIFKELYGESEVDAARQRYTTLITEMLNGGNGFPEAELGDSAKNLRIFSAPGRTELAGNHTDHNRGKVLAASIQLDCVAVVRERSDNIVFFRSVGFPDVKVKLTDSSGAPDLQPKPEERGTTSALVRGIASELYRRSCKVGGFSANAMTTVFPGSGLSSSAAVEALLCRIFDSLYGEGKRSPLEIAQIGQIAENIYFGKPCGLMDQTACSTGGAVAIDFADVERPIVKQINFSAAGYVLCVVNTGGSHADLTADYASIPAEMKATAAFFGKSVLRELEKETVLNRAAEVRKALGDRALLRSLHFFDENARVDAMTAALLEMENALTSAEKQEALNRYLEMVNESGDSSWKYLQNVYSPSAPASQGISAALAMTKDFLRQQKLRGACRVHGGGFAGTIQAYIPQEAMDAYRARMETVFGSGSLTMLRIRKKGAVELFAD